MKKIIFFTFLFCGIAGSVFSQMDHRASDPNFFPISVWYQSVSNAQAYKDNGINLYVLPTSLNESGFNTLKSAGMKCIINQDSATLRYINDPLIYGWHIGIDEPDNAQEDGKGGYLPCVDPGIIINTYNRLRAKDRSRPVYLNLGVGVADLGWFGRGACCNNLDSYRATSNGYVNAGDILSFDIYPVNGGAPSFRDKLWYVAKGIDSLKSWSLNKKPVWTWIETTKISDSSQGTPTANDIKAEVWMALIHGATGIGYFCHSFGHYEAGLLFADVHILSSVKVLNEQITALAPVLNSASTKGYATVSSSNGAVPIDIMTKKQGGKNYLFAVSMRPGETVGTFHVASGKKVEVIGENREIPVVKGRFTDSFASYSVHLYRIK